MVLLALAAAALWGSSRVRWIAMSGVPSERLPTGSDLVPALGPFALLSLASVAAVLATGGWVRRLVGALVLLAGTVVHWFALRPREYDISWFAHAPLNEADESVPPLPALTLWGPTLAVAGGVVLVIAGVVLIMRGQLMPRLGAGYQAPARARKEVNSDRRLWQALDDGRDPTAETPKDLRTQDGFDDPTPGSDSSRG